MNTLKYHERYNAQKSAEELDRRMKEEQEKIAQMSPEEREAYLEEKRKRQKRTLELLSLASTLGIDCKY